MASISIGEICDAIADTLAGAAGVVRVQSMDELTEGIPAADLPLIQVYPETLDCDPSGRTDRTAFQGGVRQKMIVYHADVYCRQRSQIQFDMEETVAMAEAVDIELEQQNTKPYFNLDGIKAFSWRWERVQFDYAGARYMGARYYITVWVY